MKKINRNIREWKNIHQTFSQTIENYTDLANEYASNLTPLKMYNESTEGFMQLIDSHLQSNIPLRVLGGEWSWSKVAASSGILLNSKPLNLSFGIGINSVSSSYLKTFQDLYFVQCGTSIRELNDRLRIIGRSLPTSGASNGQTIAGALSTGTHGAALDFGSVPEFVVGLHIVVDKDRHYYIERESYPVVSGRFTNQLKTEVIKDDELFNAALVSFGAFGIIHGVMIETQPLFLYESRLDIMNYDNNLKTLLSALDFTHSAGTIPSERPYHFQVVFNPYAATNNAYVSRMYKRPYNNSYNRIASDFEWNIGEDGPAFLGKIFDIFPGPVPSVVDSLLRAKYQPYDNKFGTHGEIFSNTSTNGKVLSLAIGVPVTEVNRVLELIKITNRTHGPINGLYALRYVAKSSATLGFSKYDPTAIIEIDGFNSNTMYHFYTAFVNGLETENIEHCFHWGKVLYTNRQKLEKSYGSDVIKQWLKARKKLLQKDELMAIFTNDLMKSWGLDEILIDGGEDVIT
ncbi:MAG: FAD-binding protein [Saprospiraceae bacterium]|nr:FAD-binding protein [Saprospiraceae bacterium]